ncbi:hypothetical protein CO038_00385 [Candidatus Pacearchaeota archaeon CG_4_9_14_0_2_um_filter_39_13]|nr:hypothetical protein [Candidatus Pacearchaeota archaeon]OIO42831.1 MAG: hypothetical protein AUJ64_03515 [Candidatus Pacearchaeota archaeon CG1_02_39_14]PJC45079.1 MAG: hypothetical protein CO038_00385 [Candidatus Pacearchaeota archaeon CG_4_9_14_0_2_um_filter_39_13]
MQRDVRPLSEYLGRSYSENQNLIRLADTKANIIIALIGVILSLFFSFLNNFGELPMNLLIITLLPFIASGYFAFLTLYPRGAKASGKQSLLYYKDAMSMDVDKTASKMKNFDFEDITKDYLANIKALSRIVNAKFRNLRISYSLFAIAILVKLIVEGYSWFY